MKELKEVPVTKYEFRLMLYTSLGIGQVTTAADCLRKEIDEILAGYFGNNFAYDIIDDKEKFETICFKVGFNAPRDNGKEVGDEIMSKCEIVIGYSVKPPIEDCKGVSTLVEGEQARKRTIKFFSVTLISIEKEDLGAYLADHILPAVEKIFNGGVGGNVTAVCEEKKYAIFSITLTSLLVVANSIKKALTVSLNVISHSELEEVE
ncbi:hypothetical protein HON59_00100 [bacterium]|jgi:hypothetical protein|nr:hypothetical protein [bacterium]MBT4894456.1 hypothetical protein [bacterium]MBT6053369.1 hypothetical protein [Candidatus Scalindua sp.]